MSASRSKRKSPETQATASSSTSSRLTPIIEVNSQDSQVEAAPIYTAPQSFFHQAVASSSSSTSDSLYAEATEGFMAAVNKFLKAPLLLATYKDQRILALKLMNYLDNIYLSDYENAGDLNDIVLQCLYDNGVAEASAYRNLKQFFLALRTEVTAFTTAKLQVENVDIEALLPSFLAQHLQSIAVQLRAKAKQFVICLTHKIGCMITEDLPFSLVDTNRIAKVFIDQSAKCHLQKSIFWLRSFSQNQTFNKKTFSEITYTFRGI